MKNIAAVMVTYQSDWRILQKSLDALMPQVDLMIVVDNGCQKFPLPDNPKLHFISLGDNFGIARAQNVGIKLARQLKAGHVLLMDQDSIAAPDMVACLFGALTRLPDAACVGPRYQDSRQQDTFPFIRIKGFSYQRVACSSIDSIIPVDYLIASGCLIPVSVIDQVGDMREDLFIDYVDIEWGLRARQHGFQNYGICSAMMEHTLGEFPIRFLGRDFPVHSPLRHFYIIRNCVLLCKESWIPLHWKLVIIYRSMLKFIFYSLFAKPRRAHFKMMSIGLLEGLRGKGGKFCG